MGFNVHTDYARVLQVQFTYHEDYNSLNSCVMSSVALEGTTLWKRNTKLLEYSFKLHFYFCIDLPFV